MTVEAPAGNGTETQISYEDVVEFYGSIEKVPSFDPYSHIPSGKLFHQPKNSHAPNSFSCLT